MVLAGARNFFATPLAEQTANALVAAVLLGNLLRHPATSICNAKEPSMSGQDMPENIEVDRP